VQDSGLISDYVERLARKLAFDRSLSACVRQEVYDHLWEAVATDPTADQRDAERRAVSNFGDPRTIAAQFAVLWLAQHSRRVNVAAIFAIAGVFVAMTIRIAWYAATQWAISEDIKALSAIVTAVDRYAFWSAVVAGSAGWAFIANCRVPAAFLASYRRQLRRFFLICVITTAALVASVASDAVLTALRLSETEVSIRFFVPVLSMAIEIACGGVLVWHLRDIKQRAASAVALLRI
jgi:hypothetical protein